MKESLVGSIACSVFVLVFHLFIPKKLSLVLKYNAVWFELNLLYFTVITHMLRATRFLVRKIDIEISYYSVGRKEKKMPLTKKNKREMKLRL